MSAVEKFATSLRKEVRTRSKRLSGAEVLEALFAITDQMWDAGVDSAWERAKIREVKKAGSTFDVAWLPVLAIELERRARRGRRQKPR